MNSLNIHNFIKGPVTSVVGLVIIGGSAYSAIMGHIDWIWSGITGCGVGAVLIFTPDSVKEIISAVIKKKTE